VRPRLVDLCAGGLLLTLGCDSLFRITVRESSLTEVESGSIVDALVSDLGFASFLDMDLVASDELENEGVAPGDIEEAFLVLLGLQVQAPLDGDLSWIDSLDVSVSAPDLPEVLIAHQDDFPEGVSGVELELEDVDLAPYIVSRSMSVTTDVRGHPPSRDTLVVALFAVEVGVTGQGVCHAL
jgi:hypothetical protein